MSKFFIFLLLVSITSATTFYITPEKTCGLECTGDTVDPFDSLLVALNSTQSSSSVTLLLLNDTTNPHYLLQKEYDASNTALIYDFSDVLNITVSDLMIKPLYCNEEPALSDSSLASKCVKEGRKLIVYVKTTAFTLQVLDKVQIQGVIFNAIEDIEKWNSDSEDLKDCLYNRKQCCEENKTLSVTYPSSVFCQGSKSSSSSSSLFDLTFSASTLTFESTDFINFQSPNLGSLVQIGASQFSLIFRESILNQLYFSQGLISHTQDSAEKNTSLISFEGVRFTNYNSWNLKGESASSEGYLILSLAKFSGLLSVSESFFMNITTSVREYCWPQTESYYTKPLNNFLFSDQRSRSDLWMQYHSDHIKTEQMSSLIFLKEMEGALSVNSSVFQNIIGTSGSAIRIDDSADQSWVTIYDSTFEGNFAYDGFANVRITKKSNPYFSSMLECPFLEVVNSSFLSSSGCPGAYGNLLYLCYWDSQPSSGMTLSNYSLNDNDAATILNPRDPFAHLAHVKILGSAFTNNRLAISNSLAIIGSYSNILERNTFQDNGATTGSFSHQALEGSYALERYPDLLSATNSFNFGQSTAVYIDHFFKLSCFKNSYSGNWGSWEGSLSLASSLTMKNWINLPNSLNFDGDSFTEHAGIPLEIGQEIPSLTGNPYMEPIVTLSIDITGSESMLEQQQISQSQINIVMKNMVFGDNQMSYDYNSYTYNSDELGRFIKKELSTKIRYQTGLVKLLVEYEAADMIYRGFQYDSQVNSISFSLIDSVIVNNEIFTDGCFLMSSWAEYFIMENLQISNNNMNDITTEGGDDPLSPLILMSNYALSSVHLAKQGLICSWAGDALLNPPELQVQMNNIQASENQGVLIDLFADSNSNLYLTNSLFKDNAGTQFGLMLIFDESNALLINNTFLRNNNTLGNICIAGEANFTGISNNYIANTGKYASLFLVLNTNEGNIQEIGASVYLNDLHPSMKTSSTQASPLAALYFINSASMIFYESEFMQNSAYSGLITATDSDVHFFNCDISENTVEGVSIVGSFVSLSSLEMRSVQLVDNVLEPDSRIPLVNSAFIIMSTGTLMASDIFVSGGRTLGGNLIFGNTINGEIENLTIAQFTSTGESQALIDLSFSSMTLTDLDCAGVTGIFNLIKTILSVNDLMIDTILNTYSSGYIANLYGSKLNIKGLKHTGADWVILSGFAVSLFTGDASDLRLTDAHFSDLTIGLDNLITLSGKGLLFIIDSSFTYTQGSKTLTLFSVKGLTTIVVQNSVFKGVESIMNAADTSGVFYFVGNTIFTGSQLQNLVITDGTAITIIDNYFMKIPVTKGALIDREYSTREDYLFMDGDAANYFYLYGAQIEIVEATDQILINENKFFSLFGLNGIISIATDKAFYMANITNNIFINNTGSNGGVLYLTVCDYTTSNSQMSSSSIVSRVLQEEESWSSSGDSDDGDDNSDYSNSTYDFTSPPIAYILNSIFVLNQAMTFQGNGGYGGALYQTTPDLTNQNTYIDGQSLFINNSAVITGGALYFDYALPNVSSGCIFMNNTATVTNHIGSYPVQMVLLKDGIAPDVTFIPGDDIPYFDSTPDFYVWKNISSGLETPQTFVFALLDIFGQLMSTDYSSTLQMIPFDLTSEMMKEFSSTTQLTATEGQYNLSYFEFTYKTNSVLNLSFVPMALQGVIPPVCQDHNYVSTITVELHFRSCGLGEYSYQESYGLRSCKECQVGFWQVNPEGGASCSECDGTGMLCYGGSNVGPKPGYWRMNETADIVLECPCEQSCLGNVVKGDDTTSVVLNPTGTCAEGYEGNLCSSCIQGWGKTGGMSSNCVDCKNTALSYLQLLFVLSFQVIVFVFGIRESMTLSVKYSSNSDQVGTFNPVLLRIIINYMQLISLLSSISVAWPNSMENLLSLNSKFSLISDHMFSIDCFFALGEGTAVVRTVFLKALMVAISPFLFIMIAILFWVVYFKIKRKAILKNKEFGNKVITTLIVILFNMQPSVIKTSFGLFQCTNLYRHDAAINYLATDYDVKCWEGDHKYWTLGLAVPSLALWIIILPSILLYLLQENKNNLHTAKVARKYSFIYNGYTKKKFYWEFIIMIRKIVIICVIIFAGMYSTNLQIFMSLVAILVSYMLHTINNPYSNKNLNDIEKASLFSLGIVILCALYYQTASAGTTLDFIVLFFGVVGNLYFFIYFLRFFIALQMLKIKNNKRAMKTLGYINHRFCGCLRQPHIQLVIGKVASIFSLESDISTSSDISVKTLKKKKSFKSSEVAGNIEQKLSVLEIGKLISFKDSMSQDLSVTASAFLSPNKEDIELRRRGSKLLNMIDTPKVLSPGESVTTSFVYDQKDASIINLGDKVPDETEREKASSSLGDDMNARSIEKLRNNKLRKTSRFMESERRRLKSESCVSSSRSLNNGLSVTIVEFLPDAGELYAKPESDPEKGCNMTPESD